MNPLSSLSIHSQGIELQLGLSYTLYPKEDRLKRLSSIESTIGLTYYWYQAG